MNFHYKLSSITLLGMLMFSLCFLTVPHSIAQTNETTSKLHAANIAVNKAFNTVLDAEKAGSDVSYLLDQVNILQNILAQAENAYRTGDTNTATAKADSVLPIAQIVTNNAQEAKQKAIISSQNTFWSTIALTVVGIFVFVLVLSLIWCRFKKNYINGSYEVKRPMKCGDYKLIFIGIALIGSLLFASPTIAGAIRFPEGEHFSELYLLDPNQKAENYPFNIAIGKNYSVYLNVANHLGSSAYYALYVKLANATDQLPNTSLGKPSPLSALYEYRFSITDNTTWQNPMQFSSSNATIQGNNLKINTLTINDLTYNIDEIAVWNTNITKFQYQLFVELWAFNKQTGTFEFDDRYVSLKLNIIPTQ